MREELWLNTEIYTSESSFLRQNSRRDHSKFRLALVDGEQVISEWGYSTAQPDPASLPTLTYSKFFTVYQDTKTHTRDTYTGTTIVRSDKVAAAELPSSKNVNA